VDRRRAELVMQVGAARLGELLAEFRQAGPTDAAIIARGAAAELRRIAWCLGRVGEARPRREEARLDAPTFRRAGTSLG
jgi:hypothetical protein